MPKDGLLKGMRRLLGLSLAPAEFQDAVAAEVLRRYPSATIERAGVDEIRVDIPGRRESALYLERAFAIHRKAPRNLAMLVDEVVSMLDPIDVSSADELVILVRPLNFRDEEPEIDRLRRPLAGDLAAHLAIDKPERYVFPPASELREGLKLDDEALWAQAYRNTREKLGVDPVPLVAEQILLIETDDGLATSLLALDEFWNSEDLTAGGPLAVAAPYQTEVHIAPLSDAKAVERLRKMLAEAAGPFFLTSDLFIRRDGRWEVS